MKTKHFFKWVFLALAIFYASLPLHGEGKHVTQYRMLNVVPPTAEVAEELCRDMVDLYRSGAIDSAALICAIVPQGNPPIDKASQLLETYRTFQKKLEGSGLPFGILLQATMGHGGPGNIPTPFQKLVRGKNGKPIYSFCPEDKGFLEYIGKSIRTLAQGNPAFFMVDDDTRLLTLREGCFCPLHIARFNQLHSTNYTAEQLRKLVYEQDFLAHQYDEMLQKTMEDYFRFIRQTLDDIDPDLHCSLCICEQEARFSGNYAKILAGKSGSPILRLNNARYLLDTQRDIPQWLRKTATQLVSLRTQTKELLILAEPDTCPHNRYSMGAYSMLQQFTLSLLEGCKGGKWWITRYPVYEPGSGQAFRKILKKYQGQFKTLFEMNIVWSGAGVPLSLPGVFTFPVYQSQINSWENIFGRMGIPFAFTSEAASCNVLTERQIRELPPEQLEAIFRTSGVLLDGDAAALLTEQGHADWIGCKATKADKLPIAFEWWNGKRMNAGSYKRFLLTPVQKEDGQQASAQALSNYCQRPQQPGQPPKVVAPAALLCTNCFGQPVITMALSTQYGGGFEPFVIFNETRKAQLLSFLQKLKPLALFYPEDAEILLRYGVQGKQRFAYLTNLGFDPLENIPLRGEWTNAGAFQDVRVLSPSGQWEPVPTTRADDGTLLLSLPLPPHQIVILQFR